MTKNEESKKDIGKDKKASKTKKEAEEYLSQLKYLKADFENYKKRVEREKGEYAKYAAEKIMLELLEVVDNLERAIKSGKTENASKEKLMEGIEITQKQLLKILEKEDVRPIKCVGDPFDPHIHECVMTEINDKLDEDTVVDELQKGYTMNTKVIRHSKVKVSKR